MLEKIAKGLTRKPKLVVTIAVLLLIPSILGAAATRINYDILTYLPQDLDSTRGEALLEEPFHMAATTMLIVEDMPPEYSNQLAERIEEVPGVSGAIWVSNLIGIQFPQEMIPQDLREMFFSGNATMMLVQYDHPGASEETMAAIRSVRALCNEHCFLAGFSVLIRDTRDMIDKELPLYILLAVALSLVAMSLMMDSWLQPIAFLLSIGLAVLYNFGTNIVLGEISYITQAIAAVLQLGVTMDYAIFLFDRYREEVRNYADKRDAMAVSIVSAFKSLSGSSLTTIAGFLALCFMRFTLGKDIGIVMAKGVVLGVATVVLVLPAILLQMDSAIQKYRHPCLRPDMRKVNGFILRRRRFFVVLFLLLFFPAVYASNHAQVYYKMDEALPQDMPSIVATKKLKDEFDMACSHFIVMDDSVSHIDMVAMTEELEAVPGVTSVVGYDKLLPAGIPDFFIPDSVKSILKQGGYQLLMVNSSYETASDEVSGQVETLKGIVHRYDPAGYITGEGAMTADLIETTAVDFKVTGYLSILAILLLVAITFKSLSIPVLLVATIELAIYINQGIPYFTGTAIAFVAPTVISCVQLGATVDYAILMTTRFQEELQKGKDRFAAIRDAASSADLSILTSALVFFCATLGVALISTMDIVRGICLMLSRGAIISAVVSIFILPSVLCVFEPLINKTTLHWRTPKAGKALPAGDAPSIGAPEAVEVTEVPEAPEVTEEPQAVPVSRNAETH